MRLVGPIGFFHLSTPWHNDKESAMELERLGFSALWLGGSPRATCSTQSL